MKNNIIFLALLCILLTFSNITQAQKNRQLVIDIKESYDKFYARTDSLHKAQPNFTFNDTIVNDLKNIDTTEPYNFFGELWTNTNTSLVHLMRQQSTTMLALFVIIIT